MANENKVVLTFLGDTDALEKKIDIVKKGFEGLARTGTIAFAAITAVVFGTTRAFAEFEKGLTNVFTLLSNEEVNKYGKGLESVAKDAIALGFATEDTTKALFDNVSALGASEKSIETFKIAQKLAIGGVASLSISVDGLTSVINAYGKGTTEATEVANAFFTAQKAGKTTVAELAVNVGKVAPIAKQAGIGFKTLLATMSQLTLGGLNTEEATTALRGAIAGLLKPSEAARKVMEKYNIPIGASALQSANFTEVLKKLAIAAKENPDALAEMIPNIRALTAVGALGSKEIENLNKTINSINEDIKNGTGLNEAYAKQMETFSRQVKVAIGQIKVIAIDFGGIFAEFLTPALLLLTDFLQVLKQIPEPIKRIVAGLTLLVGGLTGVVATVGLVGTGILILAGQAISAVKALQTLGVSVNFVNAKLAITNFLLSPIVVWFVAIAAAAALLAIAWNKNWFDIQGKTQKVVDTLKSSFQGFLDFLKGAWFVIKAAIDGWKSLFFIVFKAIGWIVKSSLEGWFLIIKLTLQGIAKLIGLITEGWMMIFKGVFKVIDFIITKAVEGWVRIINLVLKSMGKQEIGLPKSLAEQFAEATAKMKEEQEKQKKIATETAKLGIAAKPATPEEKKKKDEEEDKEFKKKLDKFVKQKEELRQAEIKASEDLKAIRKAKDEEELERVTEGWEKEKERKLEELEFKKEFWIQEGLSKNEILRMTKEETDSINKEFDEREKARDTRKLQLKGLLNKGLDGLRKADLTSLAGNFKAGEGITKVAALAQKGIAEKSTIVSTAKGAARALGDFPFPLNIGIAAAIAAKGIIQTGLVRSISYAMGTDQIQSDHTAMLHAGEIVVPRKESAFLKSGKLALTSPQNTTNNKTGTIINESHFHTEGILIGNLEELAEKLQAMQSENIAYNVTNPFPTEAQ